eukprot:gb/GECH01012968.1/.p1 GENE.gb/GECH01012968.1/~~gb/GECH01012968.1/.p1  ORF type:complete len:114 (+),score=20.65 gb/GECH01012968.1/:1-342(+)
MGKLFQVYLDGTMYICKHCQSHLALVDDIVSKNFHGYHGTAYLFDNVVNTMSGPKEDRELRTGLHTVCDVYCSTCQSLLGWKYDRAFRSSEKYKVGKFVLELYYLEKLSNGQF